MTLDIVGSGFGRTGTLTIKGALEQLGFSRCHHMVDVLNDPPSYEIWNQVAQGTRNDWDTIFEGFRAAIDWPGCNFWRELSEYYPKAKVLHTVRSSPEEWYDSYSRTVAPLLKRVPPKADPLRTWWEAMNKLITSDTFGENLDDKETAIAAYKRREAEVRATIDPSRLFVYNVAEGWEPLCEFLEVPTPKTPMPRTNTVKDFQERWEILSAR